MTIKIAHFIDSPDPGGAESMLIDLCLCQIKSGYEVEVWHFGNEWISNKCKENDITSIIVPYKKLYSSIYTLPIFTIFFIYFILQRNINVLHSHLFDPILVCSPACLIARKIHVATLHDLYSIYNNKYKHIVIKYAQMMNTRIVCVSREIIKHLEVAAIANRGKLLMIHNGVSQDKFKPSNSKIHITVNHGYSNVIKIVCVGRLVNIKGHDILIKAMKKVVEKTENARLIIVGDGPEYNELIKLIKSYNLEKYISLMGQRDDIADILVNTDIFSLASHSEGLSCSIIEAMSCGLPVVATDVGGNYEIVKDGVNGYLVPDNDYDELSQALIKLIMDSSLRHEFGMNSINIVRQNYSDNFMASSYMNVYENNTHPV